MSSLFNSDNLYLLISDLSNISLIHVLHPHLLLFLLIVGFIFFGMYFLSDVYTIHTFPLTVIAPKNLPGKLVISYHFEALVLIFEVDASVSLQEYHSFWQIIIILYWGDVVHEGDFISRHVIHWLVFQKIYFCNVSLEKLMY